MKIVINACYGGFSISPRAMKRIAELKGRKCYFFQQGPNAKEPFLPCTLEELERSHSAFFSAFDVPNPNEVLPQSDDRRSKMTQEERIAHNKAWDAHCIDQRPENRTDPDLIRVVEELGEAANGACASLKVIEIPDSIDWEIDEYDGLESVHEKHRSWS